MALSFKAQGFTLPPWRRPEAIASKWLPARSGGADCNSTAAGAGAAGCSPGSVGNAPPQCTAATTAAAFSFSRLGEGELLRQTLAGRCRGLLSGKLLGSAAAAAAAAAANGGGGQLSARAGRAPACAAAAGGFGQGSVCRQPPVCSGQPATWRVRVASHFQQPPQHRPRA
jgi:hypothetical protein